MEREINLLRVLSDHKLRCVAKYKEMNVRRGLWSAAVRIMRIALLIMSSLSRRLKQLLAVLNALFLHKPFTKLPRHVAIVADSFHRRDKLDLILCYCTELGINRISLFSSKEADSLAFSKRFPRVHIQSLTHSDCREKLSRSVSRLVQDSAQVSYSQLLTALACILLPGLLRL